MVCGYPMVSILWVNYNSASFMDLVFDSLEGVRDLDYPNYELIVVDNASTDGSFEKIRGFLERSRLKVKLVRLDRNLGFTGGCNAAYMARDPDSKYVVLLNNDAIPYPDSLARLVEEMEADESLGAAQGIILGYGGRRVDTAGGFLDELLFSHMMFRGSPPRVVKKPFYITYADGSYSIYRVKAVVKARRGGEGMFDGEMFAYFDDNVLGLRLWNSGFKVMSFPFIAARHRRGSSFGRVSMLQLYLEFRSHTVLNEISNSRYKGLVRLNAIKRIAAPIPTSSLLKRWSPVANTPLKEVKAVMFHALRDGLKIGCMKKRLGEKIDLYKAPILKVGPWESLLEATISLHLVGSKILREAEKNILAEFNETNL